jgi:transposase-like protein
MEFPEPLYESFFLRKPKLCLVCGRNKAETVLRNTGRDVCPLCKDCGADWNIYGYNVLKRIKAMKLLRNICLFKLGHWFQPSALTIWGDIKSFKQWGQHMKKFKHLM